MGKELRWQSWIFDMFVLDHIVREFHSLKSLELKFGLSSELLEFFERIPVRILILMCSFVCEGFLKQYFMP